MIVSIYSARMSGQCTFNCNDTVNVSVNAMCMATITPDLMLEGNDEVSMNCEYAIAVYEQDGTTLLPGADVGKAHIGQFFKVKVFENSKPNGASCWGYIKVEDKLPPILKCAGNQILPCYSPDPYYTNSDAQEELQRIVRTDLVDNCDDQAVDVLVLQNVLDRQFCRDGYAARRIINYNVLDNDRNVLNCQDTIWYQQIPLDTLTGPAKRVLNCTEPYPSVSYLLSRYGESSIPNINGTALSEYRDSSFFEKESILCNFKMTYTDIVFPTCGNTYKVVREWTIIDWCNSNFPEVINQIIKIEDSSIAIASGCSNITNQAANLTSCTALVSLPTPTAINECSSWTYAIFVKEPGQEDYTIFGSTARTSNTTNVSRNFPKGSSMVKYVLTDACGNKAECSFTVEVVDVDPPVAVGDYRTVVTLTDGYLAKLFARSLDDGSYDHCSGIVSYQVRRTDRDSTGCPTPTDYDEFVKFCCEDAGKTSFVELKITDSAGLSSVCIAEVRVQYKGLGPRITCPATLPVQDCQLYDSFDINAMAKPVLSSTNPCIADNLVPSVRMSERDIDNCGVGHIEVEWYINITGVEEVICGTRVSFANTRLLSRSDITFPPDRVVSTCADIAPTSQELANLLPDNLTCSNVLVSEPEDRIINVTSNACYRILRTWTVVDWCRYPADRSARWSYEQTLTVVNTVAPVIDFAGSAVTITSDNENCRAQIRASGVALDDCTAASDLEWSYSIVSGSTTIIGETPGKEVNTLLPIGSYQLIWYVSDACNNQSRDSIPINIVDTQAPNVVCRPIDIAIDAESQEAVILVSDIDNGSVDNCDAALDMGIRRLGSGQPLASELRFDCQELGITQIELTAMDQAGLVSRCTTSVNIQNIGDVCNFGSTGVGVSGILYSMENHAIENAQVTLTPIGHSALMSQMTDVSGQYAFANIDENMNYRLSAQKNDDYSNGVSTLDIILMQQHILGLRTFDDATQYLAADVNNSRSVSSVDIIQLRKIILGQIVAFENQDSWIFVDKSALAAPDVDPWFLPRYAEAQASDPQPSLIGIKVGDINGSAVTNSALAHGRSVKTYTLVSHRKQIGKQIVVELKASEALATYGLQLDLQYDFRALRLTDVQSKILDLKDEEIDIAPGSISISHAASTEIHLAAGDNVIRLTFTKLVDDISDPLVSMNSDRHIRSEIYDAAYHTRQLHLVQPQHIQEEILLMQNKPNPFTDHTTIEFWLPQQEEVTFSLFDLNGVRTFGFQQIFVSGTNQISISKEGLALNRGIYYYQIKTHNRSLIKKMIIL